MARLMKHLDQIGGGGDRKVFLKKISFDQPLWSFASRVSKKIPLFAAMAVKLTT